MENLRGSGMIAGETSSAYNEVVTINLVSDNLCIFIHGTSPVFRDLTTLVVTCLVCISLPLCVFVCRCVHTCIRFFALP